MKAKIILKKQKMQPFLTAFIIYANCDAIAIYFSFLIILFIRMRLAFPLRKQTLP